MTYKRLCYFRKKIVYYRYDIMLIVIGKNRKIDCFPHSPRIVKKILYPNVVL